MDKALERIRIRIENDFDSNLQSINRAKLPRGIFHIGISLGTIDHSINIAFKIKNVEYYAIVNLIFNKWIFWIAYFERVEKNKYKRFRLKK